MKLNELIQAVAYKELSNVDLPDQGSNQHEIQGISSLKDFFGVDQMYYSGDILSKASPGDSLFLIRLSNNTIHGLVFPADTSIEKSARILFHISKEKKKKKFTTIPKEEISDQDITYVQERILDELGFDQFITPNENDKEMVARKFDYDFPTTKTMSEFARTQVDFQPEDKSVQPDKKLVEWLSREEELFRAL